MMRAARKLVLIGAAVFALTFAAVAVHALWSARLGAPPARSAVLIVLGGAMEADGGLAPETAGRVEAAVALYEAGIAPRLHFTGGLQTATRPGAGDVMRDHAIALGMPPEAATVENFSRSTLQNALMSRAILGAEVEAPVVLVTDGYHLARSWASFRWAGYGPPVRLAAATAFGQRTALDQFDRMLRETLAWWFNIARVLAWHLAGLVGIDAATRMAMLA